MPRSLLFRRFAPITIAAALVACSSNATTTASGTTTATASGTTTAAPPASITTRSTTSATSPSGAAGDDYIVFNGQGNNLDAYVPNPPFTSQRVITTVAKDPNGLDINAQVCFFPDGSNRFIAGEDTGQGAGDLQGWGIFQMEGTEVGKLKATQKAKPVPTYQGSTDNAENYGCGFLKDGRVVTTDIGSQALGPANGQLIVWYPPFDSEKVAYCKIDVAIATAQSVWVDPDDNIWVAAARPGASETDAGSGVWKYTGPFPTSPDAAGGCGKNDSTGAPLADTISRTRMITPGNDGLLSPAGLAATGTGNLYVSSVATGVINEYKLDGAFVRTILQAPAGETLGAKPYSTGTPLGIGVGPDGSVFYADIGLVVDPTDGIGPGNNSGSVRRIAFKDGKPQAPEILATGLAFPDGIGIWVPNAKR